jgi:predicted CopG family antitoxin
LNETTTIRVTKNTAEELKRLRVILNIESFDEIIQFLVKNQRKSVLEKPFCIDNGKIKSFTEEDRY